MIGTLCCYVASIILLPVMYPEYYAESSVILWPSIIAQIFFFGSSVLLVVLLKFKGEVKQFACNDGYAILFFALTVIGTVFFHLNGFVWFSLIANVLRMAFVVIWGFNPTKNKPKKENTEENAVNDELTKTEETEKEQQA